MIILIRFLVISIIFAYLKKSIYRDVHLIMRMNKYLKKGLVFLVIGILLCYWGLISKDPIASFYKIPLVLGVISFGYGFITIIYSLIRKIERRSILEERSGNESD